MAARPRRAAADRARQLFQNGFQYHEIAQLDEIEEAEIDEALVESEEEVVIPQNRGRQARGRQRQRQAAGRSRPGRGNLQPAAAANAESEDSDEEQVGFYSYGDREDEEALLHTRMPFTPSREPGPQLGDRILRGDVRNHCTPLDIFKLFFTQQLIETIVNNTNIYGWLQILAKPSYADKVGAWTEVTCDEMWAFIGLVIYMGFVKVPDFSRYWSTQSLYHGLWARRFMTRDRFKALLGMLHISDPADDDPDDKLSKLRILLDHMIDRCKELYQADMNVAVDERMVKSRGRSGIRQFIANKPVRFGFKLWCLCESKSGYTLNFQVYTGRREDHTANGLGYDVVSTLCEGLRDQGYRVYFDNFYTSLPLIENLHSMGLLSCGTTMANRRHFPAVLKDNVWNNQAQRGNMRYVREGMVLCLQWKDNKVVSMCSTIQSANEVHWVRRRVKDNQGVWRLKMVRKPDVIHAYNQYMGGVDRSDQLIAPYNVLIKSMRWWKTLFFHMVDVAVVNSFIIFEDQRRKHPEEMARLAGYSQLHFREELVRQLVGIDDFEEVPLFVGAPVFPADANFISDHLPLVSEAGRYNCTVCYRSQKKEQKTSWGCTSTHCAKLYFCMTVNRNCFKRWHSAEFNGHR